MSDRVLRSGRGGRRRQRDREHSYGSDSDCKVELVVKRQKRDVIGGESSGIRSDSGTTTSRTSKRRKRTRSEWTNESSGEDGDEEAESEEDEDIPHRVERKGSSLGPKSEGGSSTMGQTAKKESLASAGPSSKPDKQTGESMQSAKGKQEPKSKSSDGQTEKCPICLVSFITQEIGSPDTCGHSFCKVCLEEWAKTVTTCPVDRQPFTFIVVRKQLNGEIIHKIPVETREADSDTRAFDLNYCVVCRWTSREERLLRCQRCSLRYHQRCLNPPLEYFVTHWLCPQCASNFLREEEEFRERFNTFNEYCLAIPESELWVEDSE